MNRSKEVIEGFADFDCSVHVQPGAVSVRVNGVGNEADPHRIGHFAEQRGNEDEQLYQHDQQVVNFRQSSQEMIEDQSYSRNGYHGLHIQTSHISGVSNNPGIAPKQNYVPNGIVRHSQAQPQLASQFYQQLRMSWGPSQQSEEHQAAMSPSGEQYHHSPEYQGISSVPMSNGAADFEPDVSPRMLPKPPQEPHRGSRTRSSLRRAANLLLNRSRQSLSDGETTRKPTPPTTPRSEMEQRKEAKTQTIRERLQKNKNKMGELLRSPNLSHIRRSSQVNFSTDSSLSPADMPQSKSSSRKYASAENLQVNGHHRSVENLSSRQSPQNGSDSDRNYVRTYEGNSSRSEDNDHDVVHSRVPSPGYKLRRHASGPVYQESDKMQTNSYHRGYHTADSDTDSGIGRVNGYSAQMHPRTDGHKGMPSTRDTLRVIQKKRDASGSSSRHTNKSVSGPLKADHSIQPVRTADEWSPMDKSDMWIEQGARPKRSSSVESLETEEVKHEIFPDSPIGMWSHPSHDSRPEKQQRKPRASSLTRSDQNEGRPSSRGPRPTSPARSVHFEDSDSPRDKQEERRRPHSRSQSKTKVSPPESSSADTRNHSTQGDDGYSYAKPNKRNSHSDIEDPYATIPDHHSRVVVANDNPYEEIKIPDHHDINRNHVSTLSRNSGNQDRSAEWEDSVDGLYAKVEKKRQSRKTERRGGNGNQQRQEVINDSREKGEPIYAKVDKKSKRPPSGAAHRSSSRQRSHTVDRPRNENPCVAREFDDSISQMGNEANNDRHFKSNLEDYPDLSGSRLSISSRVSISDKVQSIGKATKKKLSSMRRALSLDRINTAGNENTNDEQPKFKRSPSLRSLTGLFSKKDKKKDDSDKPGKLNKRRSASLSGLPVRLQRSSEDTDVTSPTHMRKVGKLLNLNSDGSQVVELVKPPSGPFGFYIARGTSNFGAGVFVTRLGDGHPAKIMAGLLAVGDEILEINGVDVRNRPLDDIYDMMMDNNKLTLRLVPISSRGTWTDRSYRVDV